MKISSGVILFSFYLSACLPYLGPSPTASPTLTDTSTPLPPSQTPSQTPSPTFTATVTHTAAPVLTSTPSLTPTLEPTDTPTASSLPPVTSLKAQVTAERFLSCRYGPGPEYLYLYALNHGANITLIGRTDGDNWHWVYVAGNNKCWVNTNFLEIDGDWQDLPIVYPGQAPLPKTSYYQPTAILSAVRVGHEVTVAWLDIPLRAGDEEDESMLHYIVEVWHCQSGAFLFEPLATNDTSLTVIDEPGCVQPSHGRVFVQEKHGFAGPAEIPWPAFIE